MAEGYEYTTEPMDSLPSIAEAWGHSGEWQFLWEFNPDLGDPNNLQPGMSLMIPAEWVTEAPPIPTSEESTSTTSSSSKTGTTTSSKSSTTSSGSTTGAD